MSKTNWSLLIKLTVEDMMFWSDVFAEDRRKAHAEKNARRVFYPTGLEPKRRPLTERQAYSYISKKTNVPTNVLVEIAGNGNKPLFNHELEQKLLAMAAELSPVAACIKCGVDMVEVDRLVELDILNPPPKRQKRAA